MEITGITVGLQQDFHDPDPPPGMPKRGQERVSVAATIGPDDTVLETFFKLQMLCEALLNGTGPTIQIVMAGMELGGSPDLNAIRVGIDVPGASVELEGALDPGDKVPEVKERLHQQAIALIGNRVGASTA